jgi:hypothetical protein
VPERKSFRHTDNATVRIANRGCLGIIRLAEKYSAQRVEAASERALITGACRYKSVESILKNSLDQVAPSPPPPSSTPPHDNIRGSEYFE